MDGVLAQRQRSSDLPVAHSLGDQPQDLELPARQRATRLASEAVKQLVRTSTQRGCSDAFERPEGGGGFSSGRLPAAQQRERARQLDARATELEGRLVTAPPGVPVGALLARGEVDIGVQQRPELMGLPGVQIIGALPGEAAIVTVFAGAVGARAAEPQAAAALLRWLASGEVAEVKRRHGMEPA